MQQIQQAVDLQHRQIRHVALQESSICILQHPQEAHQQRPAALGGQRAGLAPGLVKTKTHKLSASPLICLGTKWLFTESYKGKGQRATYRLRGAVVLQKRTVTWEECKCFLAERVCVELERGQRVIASHTEADL